MRVGFTGNRYRDTFPEAIRPAGDHIFNGQWTGRRRIARLRARGCADGSAAANSGEHRYFRSELPAQPRDAMDSGRLEGHAKAHTESRPAIRMDGPHGREPRQDREFLSDRPEHGSDHHSAGHGQPTGAEASGFAGPQPGDERQQQHRAPLRIRLSADRRSGWRAAHMASSISATPRRMRLECRSIRPSFEPAT